MKKYLSAIAIILSILVVFSSALFGTMGSAATELGDANKDGAVADLKDVLWVRKYLVKESVPRVVRAGDPADVNQSGHLDSDDLRQLRRYVAELQTEFYQRDYTTVSTVRTTPSTKPTTTHNGGKPFGEGGVPKYYYNQLSAMIAIDNCPYYSVLVNQLGYATNERKIIKLTEGFENDPDVSLVDRVTVYLVDENTKEVKASFASTRKTMAMPGKLFGSDDVWYSTVDISSFKTPGTYRIYAPSGYSRPFTISDNINLRAIDELLMGIYFQRCGDELSADVMKAYDKHLTDNYGVQGNYYERYQKYVREACHLVAKGDCAGEEVVIVDTFKYKTVLTFKFNTAPTASAVKTYLEGKYPLKGYDSGYFVNVDSSNKVLSVNVIADSHLTDAECDSMAKDLAEKYSTQGVTFSSKSKSGVFAANRDSNGNVIKLPATDFAYGMHDAGDYGRYTQPATQVVADLCAAYELYPDVFGKLNVIQDTNSKGEKDNLPDILDEIRWEAKFLLNMQNKDPNSSTYGGFYFRICTDKFASATGSIPNDDKGFNGKNGSYPGFRVMSVNFATTAGAAGALANTAYLFKNIDPDFAKECQDAAQLAYNWYVGNRTSDTSKPSTLLDVYDRNLRDEVPTNKTHPNWGIGGGSYGGTSGEANSSQVYMYAALYRLTGDKTIHTKITSATSADTTFGCQSHGGYGTLNYLLTAEKGDQETNANYVTTCKNAFFARAKSVDTATNKTSFGDTGTYGWSSNASQANEIKSSGVADHFGSKSTVYKSESHVDAARSTLNFVLGVNVLGYCFITGQGDGSSKNIHHYPSVILQSSGAPCAPGLVAGGYVVGEGEGGFRYYDKSNDFVSNEICVYTGSSCVFAYAAVAQKDIDNAKAK